MISDKKTNEVDHGIYLSSGDTEHLWGWGTPAGRLRAKRRADLIARATNLKTGMKVLEIGCGTGMFTEMFADTGAHILAVDISPDLLSKAKERKLSSDRVVFKETPFEDCDVDGPFDAVIGSSVLHHLQLEQSLSKIFSLLKPGGFMSFAEPNWLNPQIFITYKFRKFFPYISPDENPFLRWKLKSQLQSTGFEQIEIAPFDWLHPSTPTHYIEMVNISGRFIEKTPLMREFAGSLLISARTPSR